MPRFYDPDHGSILIDGQSTSAAVNLRSLRQQIGVVTQETILFDDTVYNNIAYGNRRAQREDVEDAAQQAFAHDFIMQTAAGLRHPRRRGGREALRRPEAAARPGPGHPPRPEPS